MIPTKTGGPDPQWSKVMGVHRRITTLSIILVFILLNGIFLIAGAPYEVRLIISSVCIAGLCIVNAFFFCAERSAFAERGARAVRNWVIGDPGEATIMIPTNGRFGDRRPPRRPWGSRRLSRGKRRDASSSASAPERLGRYHVLIVASVLFILFYNNAIARGALYAFVKRTSGWARLS
jgi:hypothetical protein